MEACEWTLAAVADSRNRNRRVLKALKAFEAFGLYSATKRTFARVFNNPNKRENLWAQLLPTNQLDVLTPLKWTVLGAALRLEGSSEPVASSSHGMSLIIKCFGIRASLIQRDVKQIPCAVLICSRCTLLVV